MPYVTFFLPLYNSSASIENYVSNHWWRDIFEYSTKTSIYELKMYDFSKKVALITGASRGIGQAFAECYANAGAKVVLSSRKQEMLDLVEKGIRDSGGEALAVAAHTGDEKQIKNLVRIVKETFGRIDVLINNAGTNPHFGPILDSEESQWDKIFDVNVKGYYRLIKECVPSMKEQGGGKIINIASIAGINPLPGMGLYCVSKAGVIMLSKALAVELAEFNIQVNAIAPGFIKTKFSKALWDNPKINEYIINEIPQHRIAEPEELNGLALYLASDSSNFTTGSVIVVDGGQIVGNSRTMI
ncbi:MAG: SDR family NAD(P)-dependent oxidoreductase [Candidatus Kariarchaeaceae archaeon]|jgi:NAD(P)-dependent dehydrogenase (short-subunit alcohol dehydrogenase family)